MRRLWGSSKSAEYHEKICSWLLESVVLEFNGNSIKHAQFDFAALHEACLLEMEGYVRDGSPYKTGIGKDIKHEILERQRVRAGIKNAKLRSAANHKEYQAAMKNSQQQSLNAGSIYAPVEDPTSQQQPPRGQLRSMALATPPLLPGMQDTHGLFSTPGTADDNIRQSWGQERPPEHPISMQRSEFSCSSTAHKPGDAHNRMLVKPNRLPEELKNSPYAPLSSKPSGSAGGRGHRHMKSKRAQKMKLRAAAGAELDAIQETVQNVLSEVQGRLDRIRDCVVNTAASTAPSTAGNLGLDGLDPDVGEGNVYDITSPPTSAQPPVGDGVMTIHEADNGRPSPSVTEIQGGDVFKDDSSYRPINGLQPIRPHPSGSFNRKDTQMSDPAPQKKRTQDSGDTPRPDFKIPPVQHGGRIGNRSYGPEHSVSGEVSLRDGTHSSQTRKKPSRKGSRSPDRGRSRTSSTDSNGRSSKSPSKYKKSSDESIRNNQQADILASVLAKMTLLEQEVAEQKQVNQQLKETMLEEIVKARKDAIDDIIKASTINGGAFESSVSMYGSTEDANIFEDASVVVRTAGNDDQSTAQSLSSKRSASPLGAKNLRGRSQLMLTNTIEALNDLQENLWRAISKKDAAKALSCLQELKVVFPSQSDQVAAMQAVTTPLSTCIRTFHSSHPEVFSSCLDFLRNAASESSFIGESSVLSVSSAMLSANNINFQGIIGDCGICSLLVDIFDSHCTSTDDCMIFMKALLAICVGHSENRARVGKKKLCDALVLIADEFLMDEAVMSMWARLIAELATRSSANQNIFAEFGVCEKMGICIKAHSKHSKVMMNLCKAAALLCSGGHATNQQILGNKENCDFYISVLKSSYFSAVVVESIVVIILGVIENNEAILSNFRDCEIANTVCDMLGSESLGPSVHKLTLWFTSLLCRDGEILLEMQHNGTLKACLDKWSGEAFTEELQKLATVCSRRLSPASRSSTANRSSRGGIRDSKSRSASPPKSASRARTATAPQDKDLEHMNNENEKKTDESFVPQRKISFSSREHEIVTNPGHADEEKKRRDSASESALSSAWSVPGKSVADPGIIRNSTAENGKRSSPNAVVVAPVRTSSPPSRVASAGNRPTTASEGHTVGSRQRTASREQSAGAAKTVNQPSNTVSELGSSALKSPKATELSGRKDIPEKSSSDTIDLDRTAHGSCVKPVLMTRTSSKDATDTSAEPRVSTAESKTNINPRNSPPERSSSRGKSNVSGATAGASSSLTEKSGSASPKGPPETHDSPVPVSEADRGSSPPRSSRNLGVQPTTGNRSGSARSGVGTADNLVVKSPSTSKVEVTAPRSPHQSKSSRPGSSSKASREVTPNDAPAVESQINPQDYADFGFAETSTDAPVNEFDSVPLRQVSSRMSGTSTEGKPSTEQNVPGNTEAQVSELNQQPEHPKKEKRRKKSKDESGVNEETDKPHKKKKKKRKSVARSEVKLSALNENTTSSNDGSTAVSESHATAPIDPTRNLIGENSIGMISQMSMMNPPVVQLETEDGALQELLKNMAVACQTLDPVKILEQLEKAPNVVLSDADVRKAVGMYGKAIVVTLKQFEADSSVTIAGITSIAAMCTPHQGDVDKYHQETFVSLGLPVVITALLRLHHAETPCAVALLKIILVLCANNLQSRQAFSALPSLFSGLSAAVDCGMQSSAVVTLWSRVVADLCDGVPDSQTSFGSAGACTRILKALRKHQKNPKVITNLCKACVRLCKNSHAQNQESLSTESGASIWVKLLVKDGLNHQLSESRLRGFFSVISENELSKTNFRGIDLAEALSRILLDETAPELVQQLTLCAVYDCASDGVLVDELASNDVIRTVNDLISSRSTSSVNTRKYANLCVQKLSR